MRQLLKRVAGTFSLRIASMLLTFLTSIILARLLGPKEFGTYTYVMSWVILLAIPATMGFDGLLGREIAIYHTRSAWGELSGLIRWGRSLSAVASFGLVLIVSVIFWHLNQNSNDQLVLVFLIAMSSLPLITYGRICRGTMRGLHKIVYGLIPEMVLGPLLLLVFIGCLLLWGPGQFTAAWAMLAFCVATAISLIVSIVFLNRALPEIVRKTTPRFLYFTWFKYALPFMFFESINIINERVDIIMLGSLNGVEAAGIYVPINRGAQLIMFVMIAFIGPLSPKIASLYAEGKIQRLQEILSKSNRLVVVTSAALTILMIAFGYYYLLIFGPEFTQGLTALRIRCAGRFLFTTVGLSGMTLSMTGFAHLTATLSLIGATINIVLNYILIPLYDITGAAIATTISVMAVGVMKAIWTYKNTGVNATIFKI